MSSPARPFAGFEDRVQALREALVNAEFTDEQQAAIHHLAHWFGDGDIEHVICLIAAARTAEWRTIIDLRAKGVIYRGTASLEDVQSVQR